MDMRRLSLLLPLLLLAACAPVDPTAAQAADKLQAQISELLEEVDKILRRSRTLILMVCVPIAARLPLAWICLFLDTERLLS